MGELQDITGERYNRLVAVRYIGDRKWLFRCDCGNEIILPSSRVKNGNTKSCGCLKRERDKTFETHGLYKHPVYQVWADMHQRCNNPNIRNYKNYGGRGIGVCDEWKDFEPFCKWAETNGYKPKSGLSLDRIDNNGDYSPENCRWATRRVQDRNKRTNVMITFHGVTKCVQDWSCEFGLARSALSQRISGKTEEEVIKIMERYEEKMRTFLPEGSFGEWKAVGDEMPEEGEKVLCAGKNRGIDICTYRTIGGEGVWIKKKNSHFKPVYWIRIPKRPRNEHLSDNREQEYARRKL